MTGNVILKQSVNYSAAEGNSTAAAKSVTDFINASGLDAFHAAAIGIGNGSGGDAFKAWEETIVCFGGFTEYGWAYQVNALTTT